MPRISPFHGLVYNTDVAGPLDQVTAPPYDVISDRRRLGYLRASPYSVVHLDLAEGSHDAADADSRYDRAAHLLADWERQGVLVRSPEPVYYVYEMAFSFPGALPASPGRSAGSPSRDRTIRGLLCAMDVGATDGSVIPHERTLEGPVQDRLELLRATRTHLSPVYGTITGPCEPIKNFLHEVTDAPAAFETLDEQAVRHRMWEVAADERVAAWLEHEPLLIADGHHRYTTATRYRDERHRSHAAGPWDRVLTLVVDAATEKPPVLPFHRVQLTGSMPGSRGRPLADLAEALATCSDDEVLAATVRPQTDGSLGYETLPLAGDPPTVRALHDELLDPRAHDVSLRFVSDAAMADAAVRSGEAEGAYLLPPTTPARIRMLIERGERLPPKSTYFWPKPRTGMVMMPLDVPSVRSGPVDPEVAPAS